MKVLHTRVLKSGKRHVLVELRNDDEKLMSFRPEKYYQLGGPVDHVVQGHVITEAHGVYWCSIGQRWEEA
jgi:hypothetical protein